MSTPEEKYYDGMNTILAPVRAAKSLIQTGLILVGIILAGLLYPVIQLCNGDSLNAASFLLPLLTLLAISTLFYAPYYTIFGGAISFLVFVRFCETDFVSGMSNNEIISLPFAFLFFGILQRYIRHRLFDPPKPSRHRTAAEWLRLSKEAEQERLIIEDWTRLYEAMSPQARAQMTRVFGSDYLQWPKMAMLPNAISSLSGEWNQGILPKPEQPLQYLLPPASSESRTSTDSTGAEMGTTPTRITSSATDDEQELIEALDSARQKVEEVTRETRELLDQMRMRLTRRPVETSKCEAVARGDDE